MKTSTLQELSSLEMIAHKNKINYNTSSADIALCLRMNKLGIGYDTENTKIRFYHERGLMTPEETFDFSQACEDLGYDN